MAKVDENQCVGTERTKNINTLVFIYSFDFQAVAGTYFTQKTSLNLPDAGKVLPFNDTKVLQKQKTVTFAPVYAKRDGWSFRSPRIFFSCKDQSGRQDSYMATSLRSRFL
jgi:hypothetical protein